MIYVDFIELACIAAEMGLICFFLGSVFQKRDLPNWLINTGYAVLGLLLAYLSFWQDLQSIRLACTCIAICVFSLTLYNAKLLSAAFAGLIYGASYILINTVVPLILLFFGIDPEEYMEYGNVRQVYMITTHIMLFGVFAAVQFFNRTEEGIISSQNINPALSPLLFGILSWSIVIWWGLLGESYLYSANLIIVAILMSLLTVFILHSRHVSRQAKKMHEAELAEHHYAMQQEYYEQFRSQQEETRAIWHDISKYLRAIQADADNTSLVQMQQMLDSVTSIVDVHNRIVSVILNEYVQAAKQAEVCLEMDVQVPSELFVTAADLYVLIGNTMDNALEACLELPADQRRISLKLRVHNSILFYGIENPFAPQYQNRIRDRFHGYGLKNVRKCVERYGGTLEVQKDDGIFRVLAHLNSM